MSSKSRPQPFMLGWEEWVSLPGLGLPAIKAKIDTGARTSALHAFLVAPFGPAARPQVRFGIHPIPGRDDIEVVCTAPVVDRRLVTSSNGESEMRYVIAAEIAIGERRWPIEITLANRETMSYRMLVGRQAIQAGMLVDATTSFRQPRLSHRPYRKQPRPRHVHGPLRIAVVTSRTVGAGITGLARAASDRGHVLGTIDVARCVLDFSAPSPVLSLDGAEVDHYDVVIPRLFRADGPAGTAVVRHLELKGCLSLNGADALDRLRNPYAVLQALTAARVATPATRMPLAVDPPALLARRPRSAPRIRVLMVGGAAIATSLRSEASGTRQHRHEKNDGSGLVVAHATAERAVRALRLEMAQVELAMVEGGPPLVTGIAAAPPLGRLSRETGVDVAGCIVAFIESRARSFVRQPMPGESFDAEEAASE